MTTYETRYIGPGFGYHVVAKERHADGTARPLRNVAGPFTTRAQADAERDEMQRLVDAGERLVREVAARFHA